MFIGAYWPGRRSSKAEAASRIAAFMADLGLIDSRLATWYRKGEAPNARSVRLDQRGVSAQLTQNTRDSDGQAIPELGWQMSAWNGHEVAFSALVGSHIAQLVNSVVLNFGPRGEGPPLPVQEAILELMVRHFDPEHAVATSNELLDRHSAERPWEAAWLRYARGGAIQSTDGP